MSDGSMFEPVTLKWRGDEYVIPPNQMLGAIARIEEYISLDEIHQGLARLARWLDR